METRTGQIIERLVKRLTPPACREHVLGDLSEQRTTASQYLIEAAGTLPFVIASQVRRTSSLSLLLVRAYVIYLSLLFVAAGALFLSQSHAQLRLALPVTAGVVALVFADAYAHSRRPRRGAWDGAIAAGAMLLVEGTAAILFASWLLPSQILLVGCALSALMLAQLREMINDGQKSLEDAQLAAGPALPPHELHRQSHKLQVTIWWVNMGWMLAIYLTSTFLARSQSIRGLGAILFLLAVYSNYRGSRRIGLAPWEVPLEVSAEEQKRQLERRRDTMRYWPGYMAPLISAFVAAPAGFAALMWLSGWYLSDGTRANFLHSFVPYAAISLIWFFIMSRLSRRAARMIQQELDLLENVDEQ
jgi:hypothetical protein